MNAAGVLRKVLFIKNLQDTLKQILRRQYQEHIVRRAASEDIFNLLPQVWEYQQLRKIRSDQSGS